VQWRAHRSSASGRSGGWKLAGGGQKLRGEGGESVSRLTRVIGAVRRPTGVEAATVMTPLNVGCYQSGGGAKAE
jgi:hypothetical protein